MKTFIEYLIKNIVTNPEEVVVEEKDEDGFIVYYISVAGTDMGIVIGKEGRRFNALRNIAKAKAIKDDVRIRIILKEEGEINKDS